MKSQIKVAAVFIGGLVIGAFLTFIGLGQINRLEYRDFYMKSASEQVFIASELRAKRERELRERVEANLPGIVLTIHNDTKLRKAADAPFVLRQVRDFYELNSLPVPSEISSILDQAPRGSNAR